MRSSFSVVSVRSIVAQSAAVRNAAAAEVVSVVIGATRTPTMAEGAAMERQLKAEKEQAKHDEMHQMHALRDMWAAEAHNADLAKDRRGVSARLRALRKASRVEV